MDSFSIGLVIAFDLIKFCKFSTCCIDVTEVEKWGHLCPEGTFLVQYIYWHDFFS